MAGWTQEQADSYKVGFYKFLDHVYINSKEDGYIVLGQNLYGGQTRVIEAIFDALARDIHDIKILKSRQLGISTVVRALMLYWMGLFEITGSLVFDTAQHLDEARVELVDMLERMPAGFKFPRKGRDNRYSLSLLNKSRVNLVGVGVRESKSGGGLGSGSAVALAHRSELCNYGNTEGLEHFRHSLARKNPNRLFVDESTARGYNVWHEIWQEAKADHHCVTVFCGWWSHPGQIIERTDPDFEKYGRWPLTDAEKSKIQAVWDQYGHRITAEQVAWIRREMNPAAESDGDAPPDWSGDATRVQNQPWTEEEAFQMTGSVFFAPQDLTKQMESCVSGKFKTYSYQPGTEFSEMRVFPAPNAKSVELKVWEEPVEESVYIVAADPAYGINEKNDRSAVQVLRCFSDGIDQVAEYAWPLINTRQLAWVMASLEGWYAGEKSEIYRIVDINGPGESVWRELMTLKTQLRGGYFGNSLAEKGLEHIGRNVRNYLYWRSDSMRPGSGMQFKANVQLKVAIMERMRDFVSNGMLQIRSADLVEEMRTITREGDAIEAQGSAKDDRVMSMAMGVRYWDEQVRRQLISTRRSRANDEAKRRLSIRDQILMFNNAQFDAFMAGQSAARTRSARLARRAAWRG